MRYRSLLLITIAATGVLGCIGSDATEVVGQPPAAETDLGGEPIPPFLSRDNPIFGTNAPSRESQEGEFGTARSALSDELKTGFHGGSDGGNFNWPLPDPSWRLAWMYIKAGKYIDSIEVWWADPSGNFHYSGRAGGAGGFGTNVPLGSDDVIEDVEGSAGAYIDRLVLRKPGRTNPSNYYVGGGGGGYPWEEHPSDSLRSIHGFYGRSGKYIDRLGFYGYKL